ncbi:MAG: sodium/glutamate symporter [Alphaproteobacteria bacterium]|nr:sodium/glutamate symporter [Alphaproteobacteria bacterium]
MTLSHLASFTLGILVLFAGKWLNEKIPFLRDFNIPEPVTGGLLASVLVSAVFFATGLEIQFRLEARDVLILYFFTGIGLNADLRTLIAGGRPLAFLLAATLLYMALQNLTGVTMASLLGLSGSVGLLTGTVSLIGGHGTAIAWSPIFQETYGIPNAPEIAIASATFGLVLASLMGGPIAKFLINRHRLKPAEAEAVLDVGVAFDDEQRTKIDYLSVLRTWLVLNVAIGLGLALNESLEEIGFKLPNFVACLLVGIVMTNTVPRIFPRMEWPARTPSMALFSDVTLGVFLAMSLMSLQLWSLAGLAGPIFIILGAQFLVAAAFTLFLIFRLMGRDYQAAVVCAGFGGVSLGATPTAIANMTAVTERYGPAHQAFIIVPLVSAFFIDIANAFNIQFFLSRL